MKHKFNHFLCTLVMFFFMSNMLSCVPGTSGLSNGRPDTEVEVSEEKTEGGVDLSCAVGKLFDAAVNECVDACPATTEQVSDDDSDFQERVDDFLNNDLDKTALDSDGKDEVTQAIKVNRDLCLAIKRPSNKIQIDEGFCACRNGVADILGNCAAFCATKSNSTEGKLYATLTLDPELQADSKYGDVHNWCTANIGDGRAAPSCVLRAKSSQRELDLTISTFSGTNNIEVNISTLPFDETFIFRLVEKGSGSNATTKAKQLMRVQPDDGGSQFMETPLKIQSVNQYDCYAIVPKIDDSQPGVIFSEAILEQHYYFPANDAPPPLPPGTDNIFCHDIQQFPANDNAIFPRLNMIPGHFAIWDKNDLRFYDTDNNSKRDLSDILQRKLKEEYDMDYEFNIFNNLPLPLVPDLQGSSANSPIQSNTGFYMAPFTNFTTGENFCPGRDHYNSNDPVFRVMKEIIGVDTEAIYFALREAEVIPGSNGDVTTVTSFIAVRETVLRKIWFYFENGQHLEHNDVTANRKPIRFYWPPNFAAPFQKNADQKLFTVGTTQEVTSGGTVFDDGGTITNQVPFPDKRFGCVPVID